MVTLEEAKVTLEEILPSRLCRAKKVRDNAELTSDEIAILYQIVLDCENSTNSYTWEKLCIELDKIATLYIRFNSVETNRVKVVNPKKTDKIPASPKAIPWLVKQVLFYIYIYCIKHDVQMEKKVYKKISWSRVTSSDILAYLKEKGIKISHNFFSRMNSSAINLYNTKQNIQPELPYKYMGQKNKNLAFALNNIVNQAGKYHVFIDVFGGSGAATVAIEHRKNSEYIYNEKNRMVHNLFKVIANKKDSANLCELIKEFKKACLIGDINWISNDEVEITTSTNFLGLSKKTFFYNLDRYINNIKKKMEEEKDLRTKKGYEKTLNHILKIYISELNKSIIISDNAKFKYICDFLNELLDYKNDKIIECDVLLDELYKNKSKKVIYLKDTFLDLLFTPYKRDLLNIKSADEFDTFISGLGKSDKAYFCKVFKDNLSLFMLYEFELGEKVSEQQNIEYAGIKGSLSELIIARWRFNLLSYLLYFKEINSNNVTASGVVMALAELTANELYVINGRKYSDSIAYNFMSNGKIHPFFKKDYTKSISEMYDVIKDVIIENEDFLKVINNYSSKEYTSIKSIYRIYGKDIDKKKDIDLKALEVKNKLHLFYSDSPYSATEDYEDTPNGVERFTAQSMKKLIDALVNSGDKFIFSTRPVKQDSRSDNRVEIRDYDYGKAYKKTFNANWKIGMETIIPFIDHWIHGDAVTDDKLSDANYKFSDFYVLYVPTENKGIFSLERNIATHSQTEIMITNYKIESFKDEKGLEYKVYPFDEFLRILGNNVKLSAYDVENKLDVELEKIKQSKK